MNVRLQHDMRWYSSIWFENQFLINEYTAEITMVTNTNDSHDHNVALGRINHFIYKELSDTTFIDQTHIDQIQQLTQAGIKVTTLPEAPIDQIIGIALYCKLNSILENRITVTDVVLSSHLGDRIKYFHSDYDMLGPLNSNGWWNDSGSNHSNMVGKKRVVKLNKTFSWKDLDLEWSSDQTDTAGTVVFANFNKDEN